MTNMQRDSILKTFRRHLQATENSSSSVNSHPLPAIGARIWTESHTSIPICSHPSIVILPCRAVLDDVVPNINKLWTLDRRFSDPTSDSGSTEYKTSNSQWTFNGMANVFITNIWKTKHPRADKFADLIGNVLPDAFTKKGGNWLELIFSLLELANSSAISKEINFNAADTLYQVVRGYTSEAFIRRQDEILSGKIYHTLLVPLTGDLEYRLRISFEKRSRIYSKQVITSMLPEELRDVYYSMNIPKGGKLAVP